MFASKTEFRWLNRNFRLEALDNLMYMPTILPGVPLNVAVHVVASLPMSPNMIRPSPGCILVPANTSVLDNQTMSDPNWQHIYYKCVVVPASNSTHMFNFTFSAGNGGEICWHVVLRARMICRGRHPFLVDASTGQCHSHSTLDLHALPGTTDGLPTNTWIHVTPYIVTPQTNTR